MKMRVVAKTYQLMKLTLLGGVVIAAAPVVQ